MTAITSEAELTVQNVGGIQSQAASDEPAKTERQAGSQGHAAWTECHGFGVACDKHGALGCGRGGRTIAVRLWFEDFDVAVTGFAQSLILISDTGCTIVADLTRREEMSCFSCGRSLFTRDGMFFKQSQ